MIPTTSHHFTFSRMSLCQRELELQVRKREAELATAKSHVRAVWRRRGGARGRAPPCTEAAASSRLLLAHLGA